MNTFKGLRRFYLPLFLGLVVLLSMNSALAHSSQQEDKDFAAVDAYITDEMNKLGIPGLGLGIIEDGRIVHLQGYGTADSSGRQVTAQTPFHIGSVTKSFTALAVMQLVEEGKIDLDAPVQAYLPWFTLADEEAAAQMTVRNLLNHTTGISTIDGNHALTSQEDLESRVRGLSKLQLIAPVGETFQYSNINYDIAGLIVEKASGQRYAEYISEHIFEPLDMHNSYASEADALAGGAAAGHLYVLGKALPVPRQTPPSHLPSGYLISSAEDLSHYALAQLNDGRVDDQQFLSAAGIAELHQPAVATGAVNRDYAMGWVVGPLEGIRTIRHNGNDGRNHAVIILMPDQNSGIILLMNASGFIQSWQGDELALNVFRLFNGQPTTKVSHPPGPTFLYWAIILTPLFMLLGIIVIWRYWPHKGLRFAIPVALLYCGIPLLWLIVVPRLAQAPIWSGIRVNISQPELAAAMLISTVLGIGWSIFYLVMNLRPQQPEVTQETA